MNTLYTNSWIIGILFQYFSAYFSHLTNPTRQLLTWLIVGILTLESTPSIRHLYRHFLHRVYTKSLNCYYRACAKANIQYDNFLKVTVKLALSIIPSELRNEAVFLCVDDTTVVKFGKKFDAVSILHDHAMHTGKAFVNGHCYVSLTLCVPVIDDITGGSKISYVAIPLGYKMWTKEKNKLVTATEMIKAIMPKLKNFKVIVTFDSWYAKQTFIQPLQRYSNIVMICNARHDTVMYDLPPARSGKRGRPAKRGVRLSCADFDLSSRYKKYNVGHRQVLTNIFGDAVVHAYVTKAASGSHRLFFCTANPADIDLSFKEQADDELNKVTLDNSDFCPLRLYALRWNIETCYYEQKTFWGLCRYMVRRQSEIENLLNLINTAHSAMKILPYQSDFLKEYRGKTAQEVRFAISEQIREQVFFVSLAEKAKTMINSNYFIATLHRLISNLGHVA